MFRLRRFKFLHDNNQNNNQKGGALYDEPRPLPVGISSLESELVSTPTISIEKEEIMLKASGRRVPVRPVSTRTRRGLPAMTPRRKKREEMEAARQFAPPPRAPASFVSETQLSPFPRPLQVFFVRPEEVIIDRMERGDYAEAS